MPRAGGSRTGQKHKKRRQVALASSNGPSSGRKLDSLHAAVTSVEAALPSHAQEEHAALFSLLDWQLDAGGWAVEDEDLPRRPVSRTGFCPNCGAISGSYVRICEDPACQFPRGRSVMVVSESMAVTCVLKCDGHRQIENSNVRTDFCGLERRPDIIIDRATEAEDRERARVLLHALVEATFGRM